MGSQSGFVAARLARGTDVTGALSRGGGRMSNTYGNWLKQQREAAGATQQQLADLALMTRSHIAHIEAGRRVPSPEDARRLDAVLNTGNVLSSFLPEGEPAVADYFEAVRLLEQQAVMIREFALSFVPGILQTERYARAVLTPAYPRVSPESCRSRSAISYALRRAHGSSSTSSPSPSERIPSWATCIR